MKSAVFRCDCAAFAVQGCVHSAGRRSVGRSGYSILRRKVTIFFSFNKAVAPILIILKVFLAIVNISERAGWGKKWEIRTF